MPLQYQPGGTAPPPPPPPASGSGSNPVTGVPPVPGTVTSPIPGVDQYATADAMAQTAYNNALAQLNSQRLSTLTNYGYKGTIDPATGVLTGMGVDPNSMYGLLQQMLHGQAVEDQGANYASEDRGLSGGLAHQAGSELHYQHGAAATQLGSNLQQQLSDYQNQQQQDAETRDNTLWQDEQARLDAEMQNEGTQTYQDLIDALTGSGGAASGTPSPTPPASKTGPESKVKPAPKVSTAKKKAVHHVVNRARRPGRQ